MSDIQIDYTSRDFTSIKEDLIALVNYRTGTQWVPTEDSDLGAVLIEAFAYMGDIMSYYIDRIANETSIDTAILPSTLLNFARLYGYKPSGPTPALVTVSFTNNGITDITIPVGTQVVAPINFSPYSEVYFETIESAINVTPAQTVNILCEEGKTVNTDRPDLIDPTYNRALPISLGISSGAINQELPIPDLGIVDSSLIVYVGQSTAFTPWSYVDTLSEASSDSLVFTTTQNSNGGVLVVFGDGITGAIPGTGQIISAVYKTSAGASGNVGSYTVSEVSFIPGNINLEAPTYLSVTNEAAAYGGAAGDDPTQLRKKIKAAATTRRRAITLADHEALAYQVPQVGKVKATSEIYSSVALYLQTQNDNSATPGVVQDTATITNVSGSGSVITYTATNTYAPGDIVVISGVVPTDYNIVGTIATASGSQFTVAGTTVTAYVSGGTASVGIPTASWQTVSDAVSTHLADKLIVGTTVSIFPPTYVPIYISITANVAPTYSSNDVKLGIYNALIGSGGLFSYEKIALGEDIPYSSVIAATAVISGVTSLTLTKMNTDGGSGSASIVLSTEQLPYLIADNIDITTVGGI